MKKLRTRLLSTALFLLTAFAVTAFFQNCAPVNFKAEHVDAKVTTNNLASDTEMFELSSTAIAYQPDNDGVIFLSGSIGSTPAMDKTLDNEGVNVLYTGFHSILSSFF